MTRLTNKEKRIKISRDIDIAEAVSKTRELAEAAGLVRAKQYMVATAASELARNILIHARRGEIAVRILTSGGRKGIEIVAEDSGPGIADIEAAMKDGFSTSGGLGLGLPGVKRLTDEFEIDTQRQVGTKITVRKWV